jgi:hypothetical protein
MRTVIMGVTRATDERVSAEVEDDLIMLLTFLKCG